MHKDPQKLFCPNCKSENIKPSYSSIVCVDCSATTPLESIGEQLEASYEPQIEESRARFTCGKCYCSWIICMWPTARLTWWCPWCGAAITATGIKEDRYGGVGPMGYDSSELVEPLLTLIK